MGHWTPTGIEPRVYDDDDVFKKMVVVSLSSNLLSVTTEDQTLRVPTPRTHGMNAKSRYMDRYLYLQSWVLCVGDLSLRVRSLCCSGINKARMGSRRKVDGEMIRGLFAQALLLYLSNR